MNDLQADPGSPLAHLRAAVLRDRTGLDTAAFHEWWEQQFGAAAGTTSESAWLNIGATVGTSLLQHIDASRLALGGPTQCQAALRAGISPDSGTAAEDQLLRAVLDGWCSDVAPAGSDEAAMLLGTMRPQWFHQLPSERRDGPAFATGHLWLTQADRTARSAAWSRLVEASSRHHTLRKAANAQGRGQKGTTEPWQNPARELARLHGPCWLAAEIAIAGAASPATVGSGPVDRDGEPFGENTDYGAFVLEVHRRPPADWWEAAYSRYSDSLSRRMWSLGLLATAGADVVISNLARIDACMTILDDGEFLATAASSSRVGVMPKQRRLPARIWAASAGLSPRTRLLLAHFTARLVVHDPLAPLQDTDWKRWPAPLRPPGQSRGQSQSGCSPSPAQRCSGHSQPSGHQRQSTCRKPTTYPVPRRETLFRTHSCEPRYSARLLCTQPHGRRQPNALIHLPTKKPAWNGKHSSRNGYRKFPDC